MSNKISNALIKLIKSLYLVILFYSVTSYSQSQLEIPNFIRFTSMDSITKKVLQEDLRSLLSDQKEGTIKENLVSNQNKSITISNLNIITGFDSRFKTDSIRQVTKQLANMYPLDKEHFIVLINGFLSQPKKSPILLYSIEFMANKINKRFQFSTTLSENTKHWKRKKAGHITYHYRDTLHQSRAEKFDAKNKSIADKFGLEPEAFEFFMAENYQEILKLRGVMYSANDNGNFRDGYGPTGNTIFSVMRNEDFSHDLVHYYSKKVNSNSERNWIAEEGLAYLWGNAYYTDNEGEMIEFDNMMSALKKYMSHNPESDVFILFKEDIKLLHHLAPEISTQSVIAGLIAHQVEKEKGIDSILTLIKAGSNDRFSKFMIKIDELLGINQNNFNKEVLAWIMKFKS